MQTSFLHLYLLKGSLMQLTTMIQLKSYFIWNKTKIENYWKKQFAK